MRLSRFACTLLLVAGCEKTDTKFCMMNPGASGCPAPDVGVIDNDTPEVDMMPDVPPRLCYGAGSYAFCLATTAVDPVIFTGPGTIDTSIANTNCRPAPDDWTNRGQPPACFLVGTIVDLPNDISVVGDRLLVLVSASTITIGGTFDAAGHRQPLKAGPGAGVGCTDGVNPTANNDGGGGGAGGSFMGNGGDGGDGAGVNNNGTSSVGETQAPTRLHGGCSGQNGGSGQGSTGGAGGPGGGGVYLIAASQITLGAGAIINASGGGGGIGGRESGGGGGGSAGMIVLAAPMIVGQGSGAFIMAHGGGGSSGAGEPPSDATGVAGAEPDPTMPLVIATGGNGPGGDGGDGATAVDVAQSGNNAGVNFGGGGGGGSKGYIQSNQMLTNVTSSPASVYVADP